jgi:hypothetical protein
MPKTVFVDNMEMKCELGATKNEKGMLVPNMRVMAHWTLSPLADKVRQVWVERYGEESTDDMIKSFTRLTVAAGPLTANQIDKKADSVKYRRRVDLLLDNQRVRLAVKRTQDLHFEYCQKILDAMSIGPHLAVYIKEHASSSWYPGMKYPTLTSSQINDFFNAAKAAREWQVAHFEDILDGDKFYVANPLDLHMGLRARSPDGVEPMAGSFNGVKTQDRCVWFCPIMSGGNFFVPKERHAEIYRWFMHELESIADLGCELITPYTHGAYVYELIKRSTENGNYFVPTDGKNHECMVPYITKIGGISSFPLPNVQLPSGAEDTSIKGGEATVITHVGMQERYHTSLDIFGFLGDDAASCCRPGTPTPPSIDGFVEIDEPSQRHFRYLGMMLMDDETFHPAGMPLLIDNAERARRLVFDQWIGNEYFGNHSDTEKKLISDLFMGYLGGKPARQVLDKNDYAEMDYISPSKIMDELAKPSLEWDPDDQPEWNESELTGLPLW